MSKTFTDPEDMKKAIYSFADNLRDAMAIGQKVSLTNTYTKIENIVVAGMGGSAIAGLILKDIFPEMEIVVERNYFPNRSW